MNELDFLAAVEMVNEFEFDIGEFADERIREKFIELIKTYKPNQTKTTDMELNITLKEKKLFTHDLDECLTRTEKLSKSKYANG